MILDDIFVIITCDRETRPVSWIKAARKNFAEFPVAARERIEDVLTLASEGRQADIAKPIKGLGSGVFEIALRYRTDAYRAVYALQVADDIWVIHAFQKKAKTGIKTPQKDVDLIKQRFKRLQKELKQ